MSHAACHVLRETGEAVIGSGATRRDRIKTIYSFVLEGTTKLRHQRFRQSAVSDPSGLLLLALAMAEKRLGVNEMISGRGIKASNANVAQQVTVTRSVSRLSTRTG